MFYELYVIEHLWELGFREPMLFFGLSVKEPNSIYITLVVWDTIVVCDFWEGSLGACL